MFHTKATDETACLLSMPAAGLLRRGCQDRERTPCAVHWAAQHCCSVEKINQVAPLIVLLQAAHLCAPAA